MNRCFAAICVLLVITLAASSAAAADEVVKLVPRVTQLEVDMPAARATIVMPDGSLLAVADNTCVVSTDDGETWTSRGTVYDGEGPGTVKSGRLVLTPNDVLVLLYPDSSSTYWKWETEVNQPAPDVRRHVWSIRSTDGGRTWTDRQRLLDGYTGALMHGIVTRDANVVFPVQRLLYNPGRHATGVFVSEDDGQTWRESNIIDIGGHGHHDGAFEPTVVELRDGRLWMLLRTSLDAFWQSFSADGGLTWEKATPTAIDASNSPGMVRRLASGRLVLVWNRLYPEGKSDYPRVGGAYSERPASWHRDELSLAFSEDDGQTWSEPVVIARKPKRMRYPYLLEPNPGQVWVLVRGMTLRLYEKAFVHP